MKRRKECPYCGLAPCDCRRIQALRDLVNGDPTEILAIRQFNPDKRTTTVVTGFKPQPQESKTLTKQRPPFMRRRNGI